MGTRHTILMLVAGLLFSVSSSGCVVSPVPEPPTIDDDRLWIELISTNPDNPDDLVDTAIIHGDSGAVTPGGAMLRAVNLDSTETVREIVVEDDGSFSVALGGQPGHMFRLRAFAYELWSSSVDIVAPEETGPVLPAPRPLRDCFRLSSPSQVDLGNVALGDIAVEVIAIENECDSFAFIENIRLRVGDIQPPICEEEFVRCQGGDPEGEDGMGECSEPYISCQDQCNSDYEACIQSMPEEDCARDLESCQNDRCYPELQLCCDQRFQECQEIPYEQPQGFTALYGSLPMTVPSGSSRTIVITFTPLQLGMAEDALIIDVASPEIERRTITLTGRGTDG